MLEAMKINPDIQESYDNFWLKHVIAGDVREIDFFWKDPKSGIVTSCSGKGIYATLVIENNEIKNFLINLDVMEDDSKFISDMINISKSMLLEYKSVQFNSMSNKWSLLSPKE